MASGQHEACCGSAGQASIRRSENILDIEIDGEVSDKCLTRCYYKKTPKGRERWSTHESLVKGQTIGINCVVPHEIDDEDFWTLLQIAGKYKGLSPWQPSKYGHYEVVSIRPRRQVNEEVND